ncbi:P-loop containing nucleoside triphosphate hydrolase protein [Dioszegia hungarica]|uniref:P-loop containing nucleoside triphosphate hydrolase protein n=1 Tax=Dioszegia hungarica TaxID=4972 RepID=A0AA38H615_9TREE|nr:P-loop containing nucleoside triphosphate hydrolase protein [Dioszegia hungarica]KAI9633144.1 P-loop containing nucleoside triphosphate hydrolase protein [Dioszegia hungarica]
MYRTISSDESSSGSTGLFLIGLSLASTLVGGVVDMMRASEEEVTHAYDTVGRNIQDMVGRGGGKQEAILFGLKDWALERWDKFKSESDADAARRRRRGTGPELGVVVLEQSVQYSFYILLALKVLPTSLSLGSLRLYQGTVDHLLRSLKDFSRKVNTVFQLVFYIAAYTEAVQVPDNPHLFRPVSPADIDLLNFDDHRLDGGMSIVASNLSFRYPEANQDVLRGINLTILPGTTLAIVGLNGSGRTTLIKALMGLYEHHGSLLLNGHPITAYDPATIYRRTSCLFQDFCQYSFTLRENVGIGNVARMGDDEALEVAMGRGGAWGIRDKVGLDGKLSRWGIGSDIDADDEVQLHGDNTTAPGEAGRWQSLVRRGRGLAMALRAWYTGNSMGARDVQKAALSDTGTATGTTAPDGVSGGGGLAATLSAANPEAPAINQLKLSPTASTGSPTASAEYSAGLSGGQWQKIGLSRAFMRASEADLVVFDEPSASLDPRAEAQLFERIHTLSHQGGRKVTTIYISHRFATDRKADQIAVVEGGTILECGPHAELMARGGRYRELYDI